MCSSTAREEQGRILAVVAPAQVQEQGWALSQAGSQGKTLEKRFSLRINNELFHQGNEHPGSPCNILGRGRRPLVSPLWSHTGFAGSPCSTGKEELFPQGAADNNFSIEFVPPASELSLAGAPGALPCPGQFLPGNDSGVFLLTWLTGKSGFFPKAHSGLGYVN